MVTFQVSSNLTCCSTTSLTSGFKGLGTHPFLDIGPTLGPGTINETAVKASDFVLAGTTPYGIWVNQTRLAYFYNPTSNGPNGTIPAAPFPYSRLAAVTQPDSNSFYLYHQINGTIFAQEFWDDKTGAWHPSVNIPV